MAALSDRFEEAQRPLLGRRGGRPRSALTYAPRQGRPSRSRIQSSRRNTATSGSTSFSYVLLVFTGGWGRRRRADSKHGQRCIERNWGEKIRSPLDRRGNHLRSTSKVSCPRQAAATLPGLPAHRRPRRERRLQGVGALESSPPAHCDPTSSFTLPKRPHQYSSATVLRRACRHRAREAERSDQFLVSVNVAAEQFKPGNLLDAVGQRRDYDVAASRIELELTESALLGSLQATRNIIAGLKGWAFRSASTISGPCAFVAAVRCGTLLQNRLKNRPRVYRWFRTCRTTWGRWTSSARFWFWRARSVPTAWSRRAWRRRHGFNASGSGHAVGHWGYFFSRPVLPEARAPALLDGRPDAAKAGSSAVAAANVAVLRV